MKCNIQGRAMAASLFGTAIFGLSFMFSRLAMTVATPLQLLSMRFLFAFLLMTALLLTGRVHVNFRRSGWPWLVVLGVLQPVLYFLFESNGILYTSSSFSGVMIALIPVFSLAFGTVFLKERATWLQLAFSLLSIGGIAFLAMKGTAEGGIAFKGVLLLVGAVVSAVLYNVLARKLSREYTAFERTYMMFLVGFVVFMAMALFESGGSVRGIAAPLKEPAFLLSILYLGGVSSMGAFLLINYATTYLPLARTTAFANVTTVVSVLAGVLLLGEAFDWKSALACAAILAGVAGVQHFTSERGQGNAAEGAQGL